MPKPNASIKFENSGPMHCHVKGGSGTVTLTFDPINLKFNRSHILSMINAHIKFESMAHEF